MDRTFYSLFALSSTLSGNCPMQFGSAVVFVPIVSLVSLPVDADAVKYKYPVTLMVILYVSSSRLTTSLVKLQANMARILPTRPTRRGIHSKSTKRTLLCVFSHLEHLPGTEMLMGRPLIVQNPAPWPENRQKVDKVESVKAYTVRSHSSPPCLIPLSLVTRQILPPYNSMNAALILVHLQGGRLSKNVNAG